MCIHCGEEHTQAILESGWVLRVCTSCLVQNYLEQKEFVYLEEA